MGISAVIISHDELYDSLTNPPIIVNEFDISTQENQTKLNNHTMTNYEGDTLDIVPSCDCGALRFQHNVGIRCGICKQQCLPSTERKLESMLWIAAPKGVDRLMNPWVFTIMRSYFVVKSVSMLDWLTNPYYIPPNKNLEATLEYLRDTGIKRGLNFFYRNFDSIMSLFLTEILPDKKNQQTMDDLQLFVTKYRKALFSTKVPIPSKVVFITESTATGIYADFTMTPAINAIRTISAIEHSHAPLSQKEIESRTMKAIVMLSDYYRVFFGTQLGSKPGWFRKHVFGSRVHFSFRAVISSTSEMCHYDEIHLPWSLSVMVLKLHITAKLHAMNFTPNEINKFIYEHTLKHHPLMEQIFNELIAEAPDKGIAVIFQRNPTLTRLSAQRLFVTVIKNDPNINTVSLSTLVLSGMGADYDGRALPSEENFLNCRETPESFTYQTH